MTYGFRLPFTHQPSRWERIRSGVADRDALFNRLSELERLRDAVPHPTDVRGRVQPLMQRAASVRDDLSLPELPSFLQDRLSGLRRKPSFSERALNTSAPLWLVLGAGIGAFVLGFALGASSAQRRITPALDFEGSADKIKDVWPAVHDDDIREAKGNLKRLSSVINERTGEDSRTIRERLTQLASATASANGHGQSDR